MKSGPTQARLKELLHYEPDTGHFTRLVRRGGTANAGSKAGSLNRHGYVLIVVDGHRYAAHRLAFLYMTGAMPPEFVDHINQIKDDNRWENLRLASRAENSANTGLRVDNKSGYRGVFWLARLGKWRASGRNRAGKSVHLGLFESPEDAAAVALEWRRQLFGEFAV